MQRSFLFLLILLILLGLLFYGCARRASAPGTDGVSYPTPAGAY